MATVAIRRQRFRAYPTRSKKLPWLRCSAAVELRTTMLLLRAKRPTPTEEKHPNYPTLSSKHMAAKDTTEREWMREVSGVPLQQAVVEGRSVRLYQLLCLGEGNPQRQTNWSPKIQAEIVQAICEVHQGSQVLCLGKRTETSGQEPLSMGNHPTRQDRKREVPAEPQSSDGCVQRFLNPRTIGPVLPLFRCSGRSPRISGIGGPAKGRGRRLGLDPFRCRCLLRWIPREDRQSTLPQVQASETCPAQKELARRQKGSSNRNKTRIKVARIHQRVVSSRLDHHNKISTRLIRENQAIAVEKLEHQRSG